MSNVLQVHIEREFDDAFMQGLFHLCDTGIAYWANPDEAGRDDYREYYDDEKQIVIALNIVESEERLTELTPEMAKVAKYCNSAGDNLLVWRIDGRTFMQGIERIMTGEVEAQPAYLVNICRAVIENEVARLDSGDVDLIVQAGLYNEIVWG